MESLLLIMNYVNMNEIFIILCIYISGIQNQLTIDTV